MKRQSRRRVPLVAVISLFAIVGILLTPLAPVQPAAYAQDSSPVKPTPDVPPPSPTPAPETQQQDQDTTQDLPGPQPRIKTSGAVGQPRTLTLPAGAQVNGSPVLQQAGEWNADVQEGFESDLAGWNLFDNNPDDSLEITWGLDDYYVHSGSQAVWMAAGGVDGLNPEFFYYPDNLNTWMVSNWYLDLTSAQAADVEFAMLHDIEPDYDYVFVGASTDGVNFNGEYWTGLSGGWQDYLIDLTEYVGSPEVYIGFYFYSDFSNPQNYEGVWIDDVTVWSYQETAPIEGNNQVVNGDFETGDLTGWNDEGSTVITAQVPNPNVGQYVAYFGGINDADEIFYQPLNIPDADITSANFTFWLNQYSEEFLPGADSFCVGIYDAAAPIEPGTALIDLGCLDGADAIAETFSPDAWWQVNYEILGADWSAIRGKTVNIVFEMYTDFSLLTTVFVDDISLDIYTGGTAGDAYEPNDYTGEATPIEPGTTVTEVTIDPDYDVDVFAFSGSAGDWATVDINAEINGSTLDSVVTLYDSNNTMICRNDDDGFTFDSYLSCELPAGGTYYIVVTSYDERGNRSSFYTLDLSLESNAVDPTEPVVPDPDPDPTDPEPGDWTAILYMAGDNNLCNSYPQLITRLETELGSKIGPGGFLNVLVLFDKDPNHCSGPATAMRYHIQPNGSYTDNINRWDMGELDMGDPQTLVNFATWAMENYPAERYYLAIDNHGGGLRGIAWDDTNSHNNITNAEFFAALKEITDNGSNKIDVLAYEACLMGMYENAYDVRNFVDYIFFFQTISYTNNASYPSYLGNANFTASSGGRDLGEIIFNTYFNAVVNYPYTLSLIDTSHMASIQSAVDSWASTLSGALGTSSTAIEQARANAQKIDTNVDDALTVHDEYIDLWDLADKMAAEGIAVAESTAVKNAVEQAVLLTDQRSGGALDYRRTTGLSIYWPLTASGSYSQYVNGQIYTSTNDGTWDEFLQAYHGGRTRAGLPFDPGPAEREQGGVAETMPVYLPIVSR